jgi:cyclohexadieny/prephenate dehydrogenase
MSRLYSKVAVLGCGLIGSSVLRAARDAGLAETYAAYDASPGVRARVLELGLADTVAETAADAVAAISEKLTGEVASASEVVTALDAVAVNN